MSTDATARRAGDTTGPDRPDLPAHSVVETVQAASHVEDRAAARATDLLWPQSTDLTAIEAVPLADRGLPTSTYELVERAAAQWPDCDAAVLLPDAASWLTPTTWTFADLSAEVTTLANVFTGLGIGRRDAVGLLSTNTGTLLAAILAAQAVGVAQPINPTLSRVSVTHLLQLGGARVLVAAGPELSPEIWALAVSLGEELDLVAVLALRPDGAGVDRPPLTESTVRTAYLEDLALHATSDHLDAPDRPGPDDLASYFHTGGTTGAPKLAAHTHGNEVTMAWSLAATSPLDEGATLLAGLPLFHVNALLVTGLAPLFRGQRTLWTGPLGYRDPNLYGVIWKLIEKYQVATMSGVPTVYSVLSQIPVDADLSSLRFAAVGASPLPPTVRHAFEQHTGVPLCEGYGLTEATCASARSLPGSIRAGSVGQRLPYQQIKAVANARDLPAGQNGVLMISGPTVFPGYLRPGPDGRPVTEPDGKIIDGWLDTGDLGRVDTDGYVYLTGRAKDLIIRGGHNIDPSVIEDALLGHPDVTGASAVGRPDPHSGEVPIAYVTVRPGAGVDETDLCAWAAAGVPEPAAAPKDVHIVSELPVTAVGKPFKPALREDALRRALAGDLPEAVLDVTTVDGRLTVTVQESADPASVEETLSRYAVTWAWRTAESEGAEQ